MVLRTFYLPLPLDRKLRELAFSRNTSKAELIREFIANGVKEIGEVTLAEKVSARVRAKSAKGQTEGTSEAKTEGAQIHATRPKRTTRARALSVEAA
jgi:predicted DNA-binding protein